MKIILVTLMFFFATGLNAQYNFAVGLRAGGSAGITVKKISPSSKSFEGIIGFCGDCFSLTALFEKQPEIVDVNGLSWFYGAGLHISFYQDNINRRWYNSRYNTDEGAIGLGVDGIIGIEYKIPEVPIAFSLDIKPFIEVTTKNSVWFWLDPGFGIKLAFSI